MTQPNAKKAVVIVEDNRPVAQLIRDTLNTEPYYRGVIVHDGQEAIDVIHAIDVSVILLDLSLPGMSGAELYDQLRSDPHTSNVPIIFITANHESTELSRRGITNVIAKPFNLDELLERVALACSGHDHDAGTYGDTDIVLDGRHHDIRDITYFLNSSG